MAKTYTTTCKDCAHWDADNRTTQPQEITEASRCLRVDVNDHDAPITIGHHQSNGIEEGCTTYLITKSDFTCGAALHRGGMPGEFEPRAEERESKTKKVTGKIARGMAIAAKETTLWTADLTIDFILRTRQDERTTRPTKRIRFPPELKRRILRDQDSQCMYCGERKSTKTTDIDHMDPIVRGGSNDRPNLQILCRPCNQRKGMQTDQEFRQRYAKLLPKTKPGQTLSPPGQAIRQASFRQITKETQMAKSTKDFKRTKYISPRQKIAGGTPTAGAIVGIATFLGTALMTPEASWAGNLSLIAGASTGIATWIGLFLRAKVTGKFDA